MYGTCRMAQDRELYEVLPIYIMKIVNTILIQWQLCNLCIAKNIYLQN